MRDYQIQADFRCADIRGELTTDFQAEDKEHASRIANAHLMKVCHALVKQKAKVAGDYVFYVSNEVCRDLLTREMVYARIDSIVGFARMANWTTALDHEEIHWSRKGFRDITTI